jgi:hypothetical protein
MTNALKIVHDSYVVDGVFFWKSNDRPVPVDVFEDADLKVPTGQEAACDKATDAFLAEYRESMKDHVPSAEEMYEMRSAFGPGETVVNVFTGQRTHL